jgi:uncharacterized membrane protein
MDCEPWLIQPSQRNTLTREAFVTKQILKGLATLLRWLGLGLLAWGQAYSLRTIEVPGAAGTSAFRGNDAGQIAGAYSSSDPNNVTPVQGFLLTRGVFKAINYPGSPDTSPGGVNAVGEVVGWYHDAAGYHGFQFSGNKFSAINVPGAVATEASGINAHGQIVGLYTDGAGAQQGFLLNGANFSTISFPGALCTVAVGINDSGAIVGFYSLVDTLCTNPQGFLYSGGKFTTIAFPGATTTRAESVNNAGKIVGLYVNSRGPDEGFVFSSGTYTTFHFPGSRFTDCYGINNLDQIVGDFEDTTLGARGFLATPIAQTNVELSLRPQDRSAAK